MVAKTYNNLVAKTNNTIVAIVAKTNNTIIAMLST